MKIKLGPINVTVNAAGVGVAPWSTRVSGTVYKYNIIVTDGDAKYKTTGWGSINDFQKGKRDYAGIGAVVVDELLSANADPDEFKSMVLYGKTGFAKARAVAIANRVCTAAKKFSYDRLTAAVAAAQKKKLL